MARSEIPLAIGRGMDRASGGVAVQPQSPVDARNIYARDAKMAVRPGMGYPAFTPPPWGTDTLAIIGVKATLDILYVMYDRATQSLRVYRLNPTLLIITAQLVGTWGTLLSGVEFPVVSFAEADGKVLLAHDEEVLASRLATIYYTPNFVTPATVGTLTTLSQDLDGTGAAHTVFFRGVVAHLEYLAGWGYGSFSDADRPDIVRLSQPADPITWKPENYFVCGVKKDPIIACVPTGQLPDSILAVGKAFSAYKIFGTDPDTFGVDLLDAVYGCQSSRSAVNVGAGVAYWWATDGPRVVLPGGTQPVGQPLELISPLPDDFPDLGPARLSFAIFDRDRYLIEFVFPDITTGTTPVPSFALSRWDPQDPRWTFITRDQMVTCAGVQYARDTGTAATAPTGYPSGIVAGDIP